MSSSRKLPSARRSSLKSMLLLAALLLVIFPTAALAQQKSKGNASAAPTATPALTRTTTRHEVRRFGYGSTLTILGAPAGSITIEAWPRSEIDITADIELHADTEEDLARLSQVNSFILDEDVNHLRILTTGMHDKKFMRRVAKDFPKKLLNLPWKIDYRVRVPVSTDLEINVGRGAFSLTGVEGAISFTAVESDARLTLTGGAVMATVGRGSININIVARSWRGRGADVRLATGDLTLELPPGFNADIDADILRNGQIESSYTQLEPRERTTMTPRSIKTRAGSGGPTLTFTVGDGTLRIKQVSEKQ
ncbi:MAG TPA: hypothetical protein VF708_13075 [Pyrinomonadaceae bacterium]|jgi:hypothetical protein